MAIVAFLGTGLIGSGLAEAAAKRGDVVRVWNRSPEKALALAGFGVEVALAPGDAARGSERVHLALNDDDAVDAVLGACGRALDDAFVVDHSTTSPAGTAARAAALEARGVRFVHAPVFMSPKMCREAGGIMLAAGANASVAAVEGELRKMTGRLEIVGERRDLAAAYKLFGNAMIFAISAGLADVYAMASSLGIAATDAASLFAIFNPGATVQGRGQLMARGDYRASFELAMARKDTRLMIDAAGAANVHLLPAIAARMDELIDRGHAQADLGVLAIDAVPAASGQ